MNEHEKMSYVEFPAKDIEATKVFFTTQSVVMPVANRHGFLYAAQDEGHAPRIQRSQQLMGRLGDRRPQGVTA